MTKSIVWRILGVFWLAFITWAFTRNWLQTSLITFIHHGTFLIVFYLHERIWLKVKMRYRQVAKSITYEIILGNVILGIITYLITKDPVKMSAITLTYIFTKLIMYYYYERLWERKIVYAYVVADILHIGHIRFLENAKHKGDYLIVGVLTDKAVMEKKPKPVIPFKERMRTIAALKCVDEAIPQAAYSPLDNIKNVKPDILIESDEHTTQPANDFVKSYGGKIEVLPYYQIQSSTKIKNKICENNQSE